MNKTWQEHPRFDEVQGEPAPLRPGDVIGVFPDPNSHYGFGATILALKPSTDEWGPILLLGLPERVSKVVGHTTMPVPVKFLGWHEQEWHLHLGNINLPSEGDINWKVDDE